MFTVVPTAVGQVGILQLAETVTPGSEPVVVPVVPPVPAVAPVVAPPPVVDVIVADRVVEPGVPGVATPGEPPLAEPVVVPFAPPVVTAAPVLEVFADPVAPLPPPATVPVTAEPVVP